ncbi:universal stress protein [Nocardia africana]|uniref:Universal stress protein Rv2005c/MT2061 n=1 Tax=Nocardia africana TaxID=134964 RepID=A0A378WT78_9NOCA|nr:universal stress protein [Nocardia africana]MCC3314107.1 universal stress protein [Nocardia africana]SUA43644.1 Universal stress protein Rv2005c/MT2061 [Nocardia africana]
MSDHTGRPRQHVDAPVLAAVDGSAVGYHAAAWAATEAAMHGRRLHLVTSAAIVAGPEPTPIITDDAVSWLHRDGERILVEARRIARLAAPAQTPKITTEVTGEPIIEYLIERSRHALVLAVGSRGLGAIRRGLLGSVASAVIRHAHCPVTIVHTMSATDPVTAAQPVLVGVDGTDNSVAALEIAFEEASRRKVGVVALHAWSDISAKLHFTIEGWVQVRDSEDAVLAENLAGYAERYPDVEVRRALVYHSPVRSLLDEADNAQLLVVGSHGRGGFSGMLLGSTSAAVAQTAPCPVMIVRTAK